MSISLADLWDTVSYARGVPMSVVTKAKAQPVAQMQIHCGINSAGVVQVGTSAWKLRQPMPTWN